MKDPRIASNSCLSPPLFRRSGSKNRDQLAAKIVEYIPPTTIASGFCELFCGTAIITYNYLLKHPRPISIYLNDKEDRLIHFFEVLQTQREEFEAALEFRFMGSERVMEPQTPLDHAVQWFLENQDCFWIPKAIYLRRDFSVWAKALQPHNVVFWKFDWERALKTFFTRVENRTKGNGVVYCDPPYFETEGYGIDFDMNVFLETLQTYSDNDKITIFLSHQDHPIIDQYLPDWDRVVIQHYNKGSQRKARIEMLYSNKPLRKYGKASLMNFLEVP